MPSKSRGFLLLFAEFLVVISVAALAFFLRLHFAEKYPVWFDEATLIVGGKKYSYATLLFLRYWDVSHPPLYNMFIKWWMGWGTSALWLRLPTVVSGSVSIIYFYFIVKRFFGGRLRAFLAIFIVAISGIFIWLSMYVRPYGFQQLFVLGFIYHWLRLVHGKTSKITGVVVLMYAVLGTINDYSFIWVLYGIDGAALLHALHNSDQTFRKQRFPWALLGLSHVPFLIWSPLFLGTVTRALGYFGPLHQYLTGNLWLDLGKPIQELTGITNPLAASLMFVVLAFCLIAQNKSDNKSYPQLFSAVLLSIPLVSILFSYFVSPVYMFRNIFVFFYLPVLTFVQLARGKWRGFIAGGIVALALFFQMPTNVRNAYDNDPAVNHAVSLARYACTVQNNPIVYYDSSHDGRVNTVLTEYYLEYPPSDCRITYTESVADLGKNGKSGTFIYMVPTKYLNGQTTLNRDVTTNSFACVHLANISTITFNLCHYEQL